jgi:SulP family sulfate permease
MNQQCLSEGMANLTGSFFQCFPGSGSLTRSAINQQSGAATQWSGVYSAAAVAATVLLFGPLAYYIPRAALAGILMVTAFRMIDYKVLRFHLGATRFDIGIVLATAFAAVAISVEFCVLIGVVLSFVLYVPRAAHVHLTELTITPERVIRERVPEDTPCGRIVIYNLEGELFFGSAPDLEACFEEMDRRAAAGVRVLVLRLKRAHNPDAVCLDMIDKFITELSDRGVAVLLCGVRRDLAKVLRHSPLRARLVPGHVFIETGGIWSSTLEAVRHAYELVDQDICPTCPRRNDLPGAKEPLYYMI